jgi:hypothetical protein
MHKTSTTHISQSKKETKKNAKRKCICSIYWTGKFQEHTHLLSASREDDSTHRKRVEKANPSRDQILHYSLRQLFRTDKRNK